MSQKIEFYRINPGGNITAIVSGKFKKKEKIIISKKILASDAKIEQVGFWVEPKLKDSKALARIEMMGGEFCGNASRSLGYLLFKKYKVKSFYIESSGLKNTFKIDVSKNTSAISLPLESFKPKIYTCSIPGITHFLIEGQVGKIRAKEILKKNKLLSQKASGVIGYEYTKNTFKIYPNVWVRDTKTMYEETACGSGTLALAFMQYKENKLQKLRIKQPSQSIFETQVKKDVIILSGPILEVIKCSLVLE